MGNTNKKKPKKTFRNPIIQAKEMQLEIEFHDMTKAELARKLNISRPRITQMLNLLKLPEYLVEEIEAMGDNWERRVVTERMLRKTIRSEGLETVLIVLNEKNATCPEG